MQPHAPRTRTTHGCRRRIAPVRLACTNRYGFVARPRPARPVRPRAAGRRIDQGMGQLESFNPATGELVGTVETIEPGEVDGHRRRGRRGPAVLGAALARRPRPLPAPRGRGAGRRDRRRRAAAHARAGQADHRELHDGGRADDRRAQLVRRRRAGDPRATSRSRYPQLFLKTKRSSSPTSRSASSASSRPGTTRGRSRSARSRSR